jgi:hypothetical protein
MRVVCPSVLRALFNHLGIDARAGNDLPAARPLPGRMTEYLAADGTRLALAHLARGSTEQDPKWLKVDQEQWRNFQREETHRCNICELARDRPRVV